MAEAKRNRAGKKNKKQQIDNDNVFQESQQQQVY